MNGNSTVVVPFESNANQRAVGTINGRDLNAMKKQLGELESSLAQCAKDITAKNTPPKSGLYPEIPAVESKPLPTPPQTPPDGVVEDIGNIISTISDVVKQITDIFSEVKRIGSDIASSPASNPVPTAIATFIAGDSGPKYTNKLPIVNDGLKTADTAPQVPAIIAPSYSNVLPGMDPPPKSKTEEKKEKARKEKEEKEKLRRERKEAAKNAMKATLTVPKDEPVILESAKPEPAKPEPVLTPPSTEMIKNAHAALDAAIARKIHYESPIELVIATDDEFYCVQKFRKLMISKQEETAKNFQKRYDKLCSQS